MIFVGSENPLSSNRSDGPEDRATNDRSAHTGVDDQAGDAEEVAIGTSMMMMMMMIMIMMIF